LSSDTVLRIETFYKLIFPADMIRFRQFQTHGSAIARDIFACEWAECPRRLFGLDCFRFPQCLAAASGALAQRCLFHNDAAEVQLLGLEQSGSSMELHPQDSAMVIVVSVWPQSTMRRTCLLYPSHAADDLPLLVPPARPFFLPFPFSPSEDLTEPKNWKRVWTQPDDGWNQTNLWAPELHYLDGKWYIYYAAGRSGPPFINQRSGVLESVGQNPQGGYIDQGMLYTGDNIEDSSNNKWAIDVTILELDGQLYAIWSGWEENRSDDDTPQHQYIAEMSDPATISSNRVKISSPTRSWETAGPLALNEGATVLRSRTAERLFVIYSTGQSWLPSYKLAQLELKSMDADPMNPDNWIKSGPVFTGTDQVHVEGHASVTTSPAGTEGWIGYNSKKDTTPGWNRDVRTQSFEWKDNGMPDFGEPIPAGVTMKAPSGECE
jgi:GH43 family beta-xylosidase